LVARWRRGSLVSVDSLLAAVWPRSGLQYSFSKCSVWSADRALALTSTNRYHPEMPEMPERPPRSRPDETELPRVVIVEDQSAKALIAHVKEAAEAAKEK